MTSINLFKGYFCELKGNENKILEFEKAVEGRGKDALHNIFIFRDSTS